MFGKLGIQHMVFLFSQKNRTVTPIIWLFIYFAIVPMQLSQYVLCIGEDGHVEFEFSVNGCCADVPSPDLAYPEIPAAHDDHCGECVDLPIFASLNSELYIVAVEENLSTDKSIHAASLITLETHLSNVFTPSHLLLVPPLINHTLVSLRTVALRI